MDLLYAVPVADLAVRVSATHLTGVTASGWADIGVQLTAITFGWIGHHSNRRRLPPAIRASRESGRQFLTLRFVQFVVEILIIVAYFALGTKAYLPDGAGLGHPSEAWKGEWLTAIFGLYLAWDALDVWIAHRADQTDWETRATSGLMVTSIFAVVFAAFDVLVASNYHQGKPPYHAVVLFDLAAIVLLYLYRVVQEQRIHSPK